MNLYSDLQTFDLDLQMMSYSLLTIHVYKMMPSNIQ